MGNLLGEGGVPPQDPPADNVNQLTMAQLIQLLNERTTQLTTLQAQAHAEGQAGQPPLQLIWSQGRPPLV